MDQDFDPRTPCGVRLTPESRAFSLSIFQSTHPMRGATRRKWDYMVGPVQFQSTHPMRGATYGEYFIRRTSLYFNPRTPCGVRRSFLFFSSALVCISIHAPHAGCDTVLMEIRPLYMPFQSTHPMRGATVLIGYTSLALFEFQSTHPMRGATNAAEDFPRGRGISIHAPHAGCDVQLCIAYRASARISIHAPARGATQSRYRGKT